MARSSQYPPSVDPGTPVEPPAPIGWGRSTFGELLEVIERPVELNDSCEYQLVNAKRSRGGIAPRDRLRGADIRVKTQFRVEAGDFLVSKRQIIHGACGVVPQDLDGAVVSNEYAVLRPRQGLDLDYLRCLSFTPYFQRACFHSSVGVDVEKMVFKLDQWFRYSVPIPPVPEQRRIAGILGAVDDGIERSEATIARVEALKLALMFDLFEAGPHRERAKAASSAQWTVRALGDLVSRERPICYGILMPGPDQPGGVPVVKVKNIKRGRIEESDLLRTSNAIDEKYARSRLAAGDILLTIRGTTGRLAVVPESLRGANITQDSARLSISPDFNPRYVYFALQAPALQRQIADQTRGQAVRGINIGDVRTLEVPIPSRRLQDEVAETFALLDKYLRSCADALDATRILKKALLTDLLSGRKRTLSASAAA